MNKNESNMTVITDIILPKDQVLTAIQHAKEIAKRNRCVSWNKHITVVSGNIDDLHTYGDKRLSIDPAKMLGACWTGHHTNRYIYIRPGRDHYDTIITLCHELAHAFTNPRASHSYSWRSLNLLYFATLPRIFGFDMHDDLMCDEIIRVRNLYEPRGFTPYDRHLNAMARMQQWYIKNIESGTHNDK